MNNMQREAVIGMLKGASRVGVFDDPDTPALWKAIVAAGLKHVGDEKALGNCNELIDLAFESGEVDILIGIAMKLVPPGRWVHLTVCRNADTPGKIVAHAKLSADADTLDRDLGEDEPFEIEANNAPSAAIALAMAALEAQSWDELAKAAPAAAAV